MKKQAENSNTPYIASWSSWMDSMPNGLHLSELSIPGTHNSATFKLQDPIKVTWAMTQDRDFQDQFSYGIRFFDIRGRATKNDQIVLHHGPIYLHITLWEFINAVRDFFNKYPNEAIIMSLKEEYEKMPEATKNFSDIFFDAYYSNDDIFYKGSNSNPTLRECRGKIVLFRRYNGVRVPPGGYAPASWADNSTFDTYDNKSSSLRYAIQDQYNSYQDPKLSQIKTHLDKTDKDLSIDKVYINFTSVASGGTAFNSPYAYAKNINKEIAQYILDNINNRAGWVIMDYAGNEWSPALYQKVAWVNRQWGI